MIPFSTLILRGDIEVPQRLAEWHLTPEAFLEVGKVAHNQFVDASPLMPANAPGYLAYIHGVGELRRQTIGDRWKLERANGIEGVIDRELGVRLAYRNVDYACIDGLEPRPRSPIGIATEAICSNNLFDFAGIELPHFVNSEEDGIQTYFVMVAENGSIEVSRPTIDGKRFGKFGERIFILNNGNDFADEIDGELSPIDDFDVHVSLKV